MQTQMVIALLIAMMAVQMIQTKPNQESVVAVYRMQTQMVMALLIAMTRVLMIPIKPNQESVVAVYWMQTQTVMALLIAMTHVLMIPIKLNRGFADVEKLILILTMMTSVTQAMTAWQCLRLAASTMQIVIALLAITRSRKRSTDKM
jgi:hypothetical protein